MPCQAAARTSARPAAFPGMSSSTTTPLLIAAIVNGLILALVLARASRQTRALGWLAALVAILALRIVPYPLGFSGAYARWQWLTFLPVDATLALGPLLWTYIMVLARGAPPANVRLHLAPAALQLAYQAIAFLLPLPAKQYWYETVHLPMIEPGGLVLVLASLVIYTVIAWRVFMSWQRWMDVNLSNREACRCGLVRVVVLGLSGVAVVALVAAVRHMTVAPLNYAGRAPTMLALGVLVYGLGISGVSQTGRTFPIITPDPGPLPLDDEPTRRRGRPPFVPEPTQRRGRPPLDYAELGLEWTARVQREGWYRDPQLTLASLAQHLNVSPRTASRVLRDGVGVTFHSFVNRMRVEEVARRLADPAEQRGALVLALEAGFSSKASFTRAFRDVTGTTASAMRSDAKQH